MLCSHNAWLFPSVVTKLLVRQLCRSLLRSWRKQYTCMSSVCKPSSTRRSFTLTEIQLLRPQRNVRRETPNNCNQTMENTTVKRRAARSLVLSLLMEHSRKVLYKRSISMQGEHDGFKPPVKNVPQANFKTATGHKPAPDELLCRI